MRKGRVTQATGCLCRNQSMEIFLCYSLSYHDMSACYLTIPACVHAWRVRVNMDMSSSIFLVIHWIWSLLSLLSQSRFPARNSQSCVFSRPRHWAREPELKSTAPNPGSIPTLHLQPVQFSLISVALHKIRNINLSLLILIWTLQILFKQNTIIYMMVTHLHFPAHRLPQFTG